MLYAGTFLAAGGWPRLLTSRVRPTRWVPRPSRSLNITLQRAGAARTILLQVVKSLGLGFANSGFEVRDWCWRIARFLLADPNVVAALLLHYALRSNVRDDCRCEL